MGNLHHCHCRGGARLWLQNGMGQQIIQLFIMFLTAELVAWSRQCCWSPLNIVAAAATSTHEDCPPPQQQQEEVMLRLWARLVDVWAAVAVRREPVAGRKKLNRDSKEQQCCGLVTSLKTFEGWWEECSSIEASKGSAQQGHLLIY